MVLSALLVTGHEFIGINSFLFVSLILCCLLIGGLIKRYKLHYLPESAGSMIFGFICGAFLNLTSDSEKSILEFSPNLIFFVVLPPIILDAGYTLKRKDFFHNLGSILLFAILGTVVNNIVFGYLLYGFAKAGWIPLDADSPLECLLFGAVISATDPVATLAMLGSKEVDAHPLLYSLVFGESVLNDAIAIVLYKTFENVMPDSSADPATGQAHVDHASFGFGDLLIALGTFIGMSLGSVLVGVGVALVCCAIFRRLDLSLFPIYEFTLVTLFAYLSYFMAEMMYLSGIMSLFFCSICLAHYNYYNISTNAQIATQESFKSIAQICETFVFAYIGITAGLSIASEHLQWSVPMILVTIVSCLVARATNIFPLAALANTRRSPGRKITGKMQLPLWFAGLRGAVAFALSLTFSGPNVKYVVSSTLSLVLFTTIVGGGLTLPLLRWTGMAGAGSAADDDGGSGGSGAQGSSSHGEHHTGNGSASSTKFELLSGESGPSDEMLLDERDSDEQKSAASGASSRVAASSSSGHNAGLGSRASHNYTGLIARFKRFDKQYMRAWFGGAGTARGRASGLIDEYGAPVLLPGDQQQQQEMQQGIRHIEEHQDQEVAMRPIYPAAAAVHGYHASAGAAAATPSRLNGGGLGSSLARDGRGGMLAVSMPSQQASAQAQPRFNPNTDSPYSPSPSPGSALVGQQQQQQFPSASAAAAVGSARPTRGGGFASPPSNVRDDEAELRSLFKGGAGGGVSDTASSAGQGYQPPSFSSQTSSAMMASESPTNGPAASHFTIQPPEADDL